MVYKRNILILRAYRERRLDKYQQLRGENWVASRSFEALAGLSRIILQHWIPEEYNGLYTGLDMILFEPTLKSFKVVEEVDAETCDFCHIYTTQPCRACYYYYVNIRESHDLERVMELTSKA